MSFSDQIKNAKQIHYAKYGVYPEVLSYAPGRAEVLGNHTDYNGGLVLSTAINMGCFFSISRNKNEGVRLYAANLKEHISLDVESDKPIESVTWSQYVHGVFHYLKNQGLEISDWDCSFIGSIPMGSGLSSSAALEVASSYAAVEMSAKKIELSSIDLAKICQKAEHNFVGSKTGLLDQFSSIFGKEHELIVSDFQSESVNTVSINPDARFLILTPSITHSLAESPYNERRQNCEDALVRLKELIKKDYPEKEINCLRDVTPELFQRYKNNLKAIEAKRASHIIGEIDRVRRGAQHLQKGKLDEFGQLMFQSHNSSRFDFENSAPELDKIVDAASRAGVYGARLSGGGWGGSIIALVLNDQIEEIEHKITSICGNIGIDLKVAVLEPSDGARIIEGA